MVMNPPHQHFPLEIVDRFPLPRVREKPQWIHPTIHNSIVFFKAVVVARLRYGMWNKEKTSRSDIK